LVQADYKERQLANKSDSDTYVCPDKRLLRKHTNRKTVTQCIRLRLAIVALFAEVTLHAGSETWLGSPSVR
jgi:hypothetical protein